MATNCTNCGTVLPNDDAGFCNNCGMPVVSHPVHPESASTSKSESASSPRSKPAAPQATSSRERSRPPLLKEQIAQQPPARRVRLVGPGNAPPSTTRGEAFSAPAQEQRAENLPTSPLPPPLSEPPGTFPVTEPALQHAYQDEVASLDTVHLATSGPSKPRVPSTPAPPVRQQPSIRGGRSEQRQQIGRNVPDRTASAFLPSKRRQRRLPFLVGVALLCLLAVGALGAWIVVFQPFSVPTVTQPQQSFKDSSLGLDLLYPRGWMTQIDRAKATVYFYDSSHTAGVIITEKATTTSDMTRYLQQQAAQSGITGAKVGTPLSFAGGTWQLLQGNVQQSGANYTEAILATVHGNHLFTFAQLAPQSIYADEEKLVFSGMRSSLQFI